MPISVIMMMVVIGTMIMMIYGGGVTDRTWALRLETPRAAKVVAIANAIFDRAGRAALRTVLHPCDMYGQILFRRETPYVNW